MAGIVNKPITLNSKKRFGTPVVVLGPVSENSNSSSIVSTDEEVSKYLEGHKKRLLDNARMSELEVATAANERDATRIRLEKQQMEESGKPLEEDTMADAEKKIEDAAEVAATAVEHGVNPEDARNLATGRTKVVVVSPKPAPVPAADGTGGWNVVSGVPVRDPDGEYTFVQALKVAELTKKPVADAGGELKTLIDEIRLENQRRHDETLKSITDTLARVSDKVSKIENGEAAKKTVETQAPRYVKPVIFQRKSDGTFQEVGIPEHGVMILPEAEKQGGETIEKIKEQNRHDETMAKIDSEKVNATEEMQLKKDRNKILGDGVASLKKAVPLIFGGTAGDGQEQGDDEPLPELACMQCKKTFPVEPGTLEATCPECGTAYIINWSNPQKVTYSLKNQPVSATIPPVSAPPTDPTNKEKSGEAIPEAS